MSPRPEIIGSGEFAGWTAWTKEPYESKAGPFFHRIETDGRLVSAFRTDNSHTNGIGIVHGGCLMTFADYALFVLCVQHNEGNEAVTVSFNAEFIGACRADSLITCYPEIVKAGRSLIFARGLVKADDKPILSFSGTMMRLMDRDRTAAR